MGTPRLLAADGHHGIRSALAQIYREVAEQHGWNHRIINVLDRVPLKKQGPIKQYKRLYPKAMAAPERDRELMVTRFDFPAEHWIYLRTANVVESPPCGSVRVPAGAANA
jgi:transposase-like protein